jgi:hypothetical protein
VALIGIACWSYSVTYLVKDFTQGRIRSRRCIHIHIMAAEASRQETPFSESIPPSCSIASRTGWSTFAIPTWSHTIPVRTFFQFGESIKPQPRLDRGGGEPLAHLGRSLYVSLSYHQHRSFIEVNVPLIVGSSSLLLVMSGVSSEGIVAIGGRYGSVSSICDTQTIGLISIDLFLYTRGYPCDHCTCRCKSECHEAIQLPGECRAPPVYVSI